MNISDAGLRFIANEEGIRTRVYLDQAGLPTIGVGHLLSREELESGQIVLSTGRMIIMRNREISQFDALELLHDDASKTAERVSALVMVELNQNQFDALVSLAFNIGTGAFERSTLCKMLNAKNLADIPDQFRAWNKVTKRGKKVVSKGLAARREREVTLWHGGNEIITPIKQQEGLAMAEVLRGRKTYFSALVMVLVGLAEVAGYSVPGFDPVNAGQLIVEGAGVFFMRMGINQSTA